MADLTFKNIEDVQINEQIISYNKKLNTFEIMPVTECIIRHNIDCLIEIIFDDNSKLLLTPGHPLWTLEGWKALDFIIAFLEHGVITHKLHIGDQLPTFDRQIKTIIAINEVIVPLNCDVYDLSVSKYHTFIVNNIIAHNAAAMAKYASGGLVDQTGLAWLDGTKEKPEYVLDAKSTAKMFEAIETVKTLDNGAVKELLATLQATTASMIATMSSGIAAQNSTGNMAIDRSQTSSIYNINADFPNATDKDSILAAFDNLRNLASQYANRR